MANLLSINNYYYRRGGSDVFFLAQNLLFEQLGWQVAPFAMHHPNNLATKWDRYFVEEIEFGHEYSVLEKISMASKVVYSFEAKRKLRMLMEVFQPDVAHLHCIYHHISPSIFSVLREQGIPIVMTAHDLKIACPAYKMLNDTGICERCRDGSVLNVVKHKCVRNSFSASIVVATESLLHKTLNTYKNHLGKVIVPSRFYMKKFMEWGWPEEKFSYIPNYIDAGEFEPDYAAGDYFLYFGRLAPEKGVETLMRAAAIAGIKLRIAGTGPIENTLHALRDTLQADIEFLGFRSGAALHDLIRRARAVVLPSEWYENAPLSILESYALGKPVIGARIGGIPELLIEDETGWSFTSGDIPDLGKVLARIASMPDAMLSAKGRNARELVERQFTRLRYASALLSLYSELGIKVAT